MFLLLYKIAVQKSKKNRYNKKYKNLALKILQINYKPNFLRKIKTIFRDNATIV